MPILATPSELSGHQKKNKINKEHVQLWGKSCEGGTEKMEGRRWALDLIQTHYTHIWILNINLPVFWFCLFVLKIHLCLLVTLLSKIVPTTLPSAFGAETESQSNISPNSHLVLEGNKGWCERATLRDSSGVSCLTAVPEPFPFSQTELGGFYFFLCLLKEVNLSFIHNLMRKFLFMFCQSQAVP